MRYSPEALTAFTEAVDCGSFSAAARHSCKSQPMISIAIANLEADLGVTLSDRVTQQPTLTPQGEQTLSYIKATFAASERLNELVVSLVGETEPRLTFVFSDTLHPDVLENLLVQFSRRLPHTEFKYLIGEDEDVIDLLQKTRAQVGLTKARDRYPTDIGSTRLPLQTAMGIYAAPDHPLVTQDKVVWDKLCSWRELRLSTFLASATEPAAGQVWSVPNYLLLFSMTVRGFGWRILLCALVTGFAPQGGLVVLDTPDQPRVVSVDLLWNKKAPPGAAGSWLRGHLQRRER